jgi:hypothetical protein
MSPHRFSGNGSQWRCFFCFRVPQLRSLLADTFLTSRLGVAAQRLPTIGAPPPPKPPRVAYSQNTLRLRLGCCPQALCRLTGLSFDFSNRAFTHSPQFLYCRVISLQTRTWRVPLLRVSAVVITRPCSHGNVCIELLPSNGRLCWLHNSGSQQK